MKTNGDEAKFKKVCATVAQDGSSGHFVHLIFFKVVSGQNDHLARRKSRNMVVIKLDTKGKALSYTITSRELVKQVPIGSQGLHLWGVPQSP